MRVRRVLLIFLSVIAISVRADLDSYSIFKRALGEWTGRGVTENPKFNLDFKSAGSSRIKISKNSKIVTVRGEIQRQDTNQSYAYTCKFTEKKGGDIVASLRSEDDFEAEFPIQIENGGALIQGVHVDEKTGLMVMAKAGFEGVELVVETKVMLMGVIILTSRDVYVKD